MERIKVRRQKEGQGVKKKINKVNRKDGEENEEIKREAEDVQYLAIYKVLIHFLSNTFHRGVRYNFINTARGAPPSLGIVVDGCRVGNHPLIKRLLIGVFNLKLPKPRYSETWDVQLVLEKLKTMVPLCSLQLKELTLKLIMLMTLMQAARVQTLHLLMFENKISIGKDSLCLVREQH